MICVHLRPAVYRFLFMLRGFAVIILYLRSQRSSASKSCFIFMLRVFAVIIFFIRVHPDDLRSSAYGVKPDPSQRAPV